MQSNLISYLVASVLLILLALLHCWRWRFDKTAPAVSKPTQHKREPKPFSRYTRKPECELCERVEGAPLQMPGAPPPHMSFTRGRRRQIETTGHFCPYDGCSYYGWVGLGNIRANGHPNGRHWRQLYCLGCHGYFLETVDTPFHAKQVNPDKLVWTIATLAEGMGIRAVARVFETDPNTVLRWLVEAAEHLEAFTRYYMRDLYVEQVQMDELFALLSAVKEGGVFCISPDKVHSRI